MTTTRTAEIDDIRSRLRLAHISEIGTGAGHALHHNGITAATISPGDMTTYGFMLIDQHQVGVQVVRGCRFAMGSTFGRINGLPDNLGRLDPGYMADKFIDPRYANLHTSVVYAEFYAAVARGWSVGQVEDGAK